MKYVSTRDDSETKKKCFTFFKAISTGYALDGGLFCPETLPTITKEIIQSWYKLTYQELTYAILRLFIDETEIPNDNLRHICNESFKGFTNPDHAVNIVPLAANSETTRTSGNNNNVYITELFHGPTFCFKDFGLRVVINMLSFFANKRKQKFILLVSTTGDTGPAAVQAVSDISNPYLSIIVHYPKGQISNFQRKQLTTINSPSVRIVEFEGNGDDMDLPIKNILNSKQRRQVEDECHREEEEEEEVLCCGVNSYNIGRPLVQMVHFIWTYLRVSESILKKKNMGPQMLSTTKPVTIDIVLPTGAMGNIAGGYMAKKMGIPIRKLIAGVNINDITHRVFSTGLFNKSDTMKQTISEAINIQLPYNFERLLYYLTGCNSHIVKEWMTIIDKTKQFKLDKSWLQRLQHDFCSERITDDETCETIRYILQEYSYYIDPHTSVAITTAIKLKYLSKNNNKNNASSNSSSSSSSSSSRSTTGDSNNDADAIAIFATASPCKFEEALTRAIGQEGWDIYQSDKFPKQAKLILEKEEIAPTIYKNETNEPLIDVQLRWEQELRKLIEEFLELTADN